LECDNKLVTHHSWFASPLLDLQADSRTCVRTGGAPLIPPRHLYLDRLSKMSDMASSIVHTPKWSLPRKHAHLFSQTGSLVVSAFLNQNGNQLLFFLP